ncbi:hypothetical protein R3P38DRAFT_2812155 [Favolaschia claudopus]|uniref:Uncharacterized protein n=1 Tax=Favolaschia claudopus TaxID=2862362 RepID=A0AAV9Z7Z9_9AGAR
MTCTVYNRPADTRANQGRVDVVIDRKSRRSRQGARKRIGDRGEVSTVLDSKIDITEVEGSFEGSVLSVVVPLAGRIELRRTNGKLEWSSENKGSTRRGIGTSGNIIAFLRDQPAVLAVVEAELSVHVDDVDNVEAVSAEGGRAYSSPRSFALHHACRRSDEQVAAVRSSDIVIRMRERYCAVECGPLAEFNPRAPEMRGVAADDGRVAIPWAGRAGRAVQEQGC